MGDGDGPKQVMAHKTPGISGNSKMDGKKTLSHATERGLSDENIPEKEVHCPCIMHATQDVDLMKERVNDKKSALQKHRQKNQKPLRPLKVSQNTVVDGHDLNGTEIWQTTDNECQSLSEADAEQLRDYRQKKCLMGREASDRAQDKNSRSVHTNSIAVEDGDKRHGIQQKVKSDKEKRRRLCTPKNQSSPIPIRSTIRQVRF